MEITAYLVKQHDLVPRRRRNCGECGLRRLTTKCTLIATTPGVYPVEVIEWFCNECLTKTPPWPSLED